eukprot:15236807-Alexandrium_andersonii.AAC.1
MPQGADASAIVPLVLVPVSRFADLPQSALVALVEKQDRSMQELKTKLKRSQRMVTYWKGQCDTLRGAIVEARAGSGGANDLAIEHVKHKRLPAKTMIAIGLRRNLGFLSAADLGPALLADISK